MPYINLQTALKYGYDNPNLQTIQVPKILGDVSTIQKLLFDNGYLFRNWRQTKNFYRFIQNDVVIGAHYYSKKLPNGIVMTYQKF